MTGVAETIEHLRRVNDIVQGTTLPRVEAMGGDHRARPMALLVLA